MINLVKKIKTSKGSVYTFDIDTSSDLASLPTGSTGSVIGSVANCISEGISYVLNSSNEWVKQDLHINYNEVI